MARQYREHLRAQDERYADLSARFRTLTPEERREHDRLGELREQAIRRLPRQLESARARLDYTLWNAARLGVRA